MSSSISSESRNQDRGREDCLDGLGGISVIDFRPLYTVTLHDMQRRLAQEIQKIEGENVTDEQLSRMRGTLHEYSTSSLALTALTCLPNTPPSQRAP
jgi:hypothetical protein